MLDSVSVNDFLMLAGLMVFLGVAGGFVAGLLGVGGGTVFVPGLYFVFQYLGYDSAHIMMLCVGTSLAIIIPTGISSSYAHYKKGSFSMDLVRKIGIGIVIGVILGTVLADYLGGFMLQIIFVVCIFLVAGLVLVDTKRFSLGTELPPMPWPAAMGCFNGTLSTLMGIGGGMLNVPYMTLYGVPVHKAVGSAAAMGVIVAIAGALGFIVIGMDQENLPPFSAGYVNLIALLCIVPVSVLSAPLGVKAAHFFSPRALKKVFSVYLVIVGLKMSYDTFLSGM